MSEELETGEAGRSRKPKWQVMVYLAGDNNLSAFGISVLQELEAANPNADIRVLACFDANTPRPRGSRYVEINCGSNGQHGMNWRLHNDMVSPEERGGGHPVFAPDFCNPHPEQVRPVVEPNATTGLARFLGWAMSKPEADNYMLILFGHGTAVAGKTFLTDTNPPSFLRLKEFKHLLDKHFKKANRKLDILACDNCVMNGIETAYEIKDSVSYMLGSQGLMLAMGWPYKKIIEDLNNEPTADPRTVADNLLKACARNLLDFTLMDRSSEQSLCDLTELSKHVEAVKEADEKSAATTAGDAESNAAVAANTEGNAGSNETAAVAAESLAPNIIQAVRNLSAKLQECLRADPKTGAIHCPPVRDAVRLARLEAQSYWDETFVDLYDFSELLLKHCNAYHEQQEMFLAGLDDKVTDERFLESEAIKLSADVTICCRDVMDSVGSVVVESYYIGCDLQYSRGLSIYFPWTLPEGPYFFHPVNRADRDYELRTAFDEYRTYAFAHKGGGDWAAFLRTFFKATLRDVRRPDPTGFEMRTHGFVDFIPREHDEPLPINLQKTGTDGGKEDSDCTCPKIKNYPRRNYLSPADCLRRVTPGVTALGKAPVRGGVTRGPNAEDAGGVSYLGWVVRGLVADVIAPLPSNGDTPKPRATGGAEPSSAGSAE